MTFQNCLFLGKLIQVPPDADLKKRQRDFVSRSQVIWGLLINEKQFYVHEQCCTHPVFGEVSFFFTENWVQFSIDGFCLKFCSTIIIRTNPQIFCYSISFLEVNIIQAKCFLILPFNKGWKCWNFGKENSEQGKLVIWINYLL